MATAVSGVAQCAALAVLGLGVWCGAGAARSLTLFRRWIALGLCPATIGVLWWRTTPSAAAAIVAVTVAMWSQAIVVARQARRAVGRAPPQLFGDYPFSFLLLTGYYAGIIAVFGALMPYCHALLAEAVGVVR
jgi:hypothetical protein